MSEDVVKLTSHRYEIDTKLDKVGEINLNFFENRYLIRFSDFPNLSDSNDIRYLNDMYCVGFTIPSVSLSTHNQVRHGRNNIIPLGDKEEFYQTSLTFEADENMYNYYMFRDYIMKIKEGTIENNGLIEDYYSNYKIGFIEIKFLDNSANPKTTRKMYWENVYPIGISSLSVDPTKERVKFNVDVVFEREGKEVINKV